MFGHKSSAVGIHIIEQVIWQNGSVGGIAQRAIQRRRLLPHPPPTRSNRTLDARKRRSNRLAARDPTGGEGIDQSRLTHQSGNSLISSIPSRRGFEFVAKRHFSKNLNIFFAWCSFRRKLNSRTINLSDNYERMSDKKWR